MKKLFHAVAIPIKLLALFIIVLCAGVVWFCAELIDRIDLLQVWLFPEQ